MYFAGGYLRRSLDVLECFDPQTLKWTILSPLSVPKSGLGAAYVGMVMIIQNDKLPLNPPLLLKWRWGSFVLKDKEKNLPQGFKSQTDECFVVRCYSFELHWWVRSCISNSSASLILEWRNDILVTLGSGRANCQVNLDCIKLQSLKLCQLSLDPPLRSQESRKWSPTKFLIVKQILLASTSGNV